MRYANAVDVTKIIDIDANEDSQTVVEALGVMAGHGLAEAVAALIAS